MALTLLLAVVAAIAAIVGLVWLWFNAPIAFWILAGVGGVVLVWVMVTLWYVDRNPDTF